MTTSAGSIEASSANSRGSGNHGPDVSLALDTRRTELVEAQPADDHDKPRTRVFDRIEVRAEEPREGLLNDVFGVAVGAEQAVGDVEQEMVVVRPSVGELFIALDH